MSAVGKSIFEKMDVPLLDLKAQYRQIKDPVRAAIDEVCDSQWFVMGPKVKELEERIRQLQRVPARRRRIVRNGRVACRADGTRGRTPATR